MYHNYHHDHDQIMQEKMWYGLWQKSVGREVLAPIGDSLQHCKPQLLTIDDHDEDDNDGHDKHDHGS